MTKKSTKTEIDYKGLIRGRKIPILTLDNRWHQLFPGGVKTPDIKRLEDDLNTKIKKQGKVNNELIELRKLKQKLMKQIMTNMDTASDTKTEARRQKKLEKSKKLIEDINNKLENYEEQQYDFPHEIREANMALMIATAEECYTRIQRSEAELKLITEWINKTRVELKKQILIKQEKEELNEYMYSYLHDMLGPEFMEVFDDKHKK